MGYEETSRKVLVHHDIVEDGNELDADADKAPRCLVMFGIFWFFFVF